MSESNMPYYHEMFEEYMECVKKHVEVILDRGEEYFDREINEYDIPMSFIQDFMRYAITTDWDGWWKWISEEENMNHEESAEEYAEEWSCHIDQYYCDEVITNIAKYKKDNNIT